MNTFLKSFLFLLCLPAYLSAQKFSTIEIDRFQKQAQQVTIIRDTWGIPHISGKTDADAVFGLLYAQCEDDFKRVEMNYIEKLGRLSEIKGESELYNDLLIRLLIDSTKAIAEYRNAEPWLKKILNAYADGINFYLYKHPSVKPALLSRFEPWFPLLWTDGSIGAINTANITTADLKSFYGGNNSTSGILERSSSDVVGNMSTSEHNDPQRQTGSNGFALAPSKTASGNAILYINPHVTFYFRPEVHVQSEEGLNAYGAVTWGQFFIYQGFNEYCGWMHTSANVDVADVYAEKIVTKNKKLYYEYDKKLRPVIQKRINLRYLDGNTLKNKRINAYFTHHGPIMAKRDNKWVSLKSFNRSKVSLIQSWQRTKAKGLEDYKKVMELKGNTSNSTVFADNKGNIAYWHGNYIPIRDKKSNWSKIMDGSTSATEWKGLHTTDEIVHSYNPAGGFLQNCNSTPFTVAGKDSPKKSEYPVYMAPDGENFRGINAVRVLSKGNNYTIDKIITDGYDNYLTAFEVLIPTLVNVFEKNITPRDSLYKLLSEPIAVLKKWDFRTTENSVATTLAIEWAQKLSPTIQKLYIDDGEIDQVESTKRFAANATVDQLMPTLQSVVENLNQKFGTWQVPWGDINRFQRITGDVQLKYDDSKPSLPVGFASALWGCLPSYNSRYFEGTQKRYGVSGNSFICAVEFIQKDAKGCFKSKSKIFIGRR